MNKTVKTILMVVGLVLTVYGIYKLVSPEAAVSIGDFSIETQDNKDAYITIGLGLAALLISFLGNKKA